ncbi:hypothetical protein [Microbacterium sp.]|uniref:hypothetical protein n=1 Tax=Microbacterium sp. TaxID=51671 RepID=UPI002736F6DB|nr:hypothetical protein [Microbacterium sp.]MDP3951159.1 hypothetical protein [Microbacterium sp.]
MTLGLSTDIDLVLSTQPEPTPALQWEARHSGGWRDVEEGWLEVQRLIGSLNGSTWPWTGLFRADGARWAQVLGTADAMIVEMSAGTGEYWSLSRPGDLGRDVEMPADCRKWVPRAFEAELWTAAEADILVQRWLRTGALRGAGLILQEPRFMFNRA